MVFLMANIFRPRHSWDAVVLLAFMPCGVQAALPPTIDLAFLQPDATLQGGYPAGGAGSALCIGDLNGDNWPDIVVSSCAAEPLGGLRDGELTVVWGAFPGLSDVTSLSSSIGMSHIYGPSDGDPSYCRLVLGDFNGDGFDDILWSHPGSPDPAWSGMAYMIPGKADFPDVIDLGFPSPGVVVIAGHDFTGFMGYGLAAADFDGDGLDDMILAAPGMLYSEVYIIAGSSCLLPSYWTGTDQQGMTRIIDVEQYRGTGYSIASGYIDRDGLEDLALGAPGVTSGIVRDGRVHVLIGSSALGDTVLITDSILEPRIVMPQFSQGQLGQDVAFGRVDDDDDLDLIVSSLSADAAGCIDCGAVYVIRNAQELADTTWLGLTSQPLHRLYGSGSYTWYGLEIALGDLDGDRRDDVIVSNWPIQENQRARTVIAFASALTSDVHMLATDPGFTRIIEKKVGDRLGTSLTCGDLDRDGLDDLVIGAPAADPPSIGNAGEIYLISGCYVASSVPLIPAFSLRQNYPNPFNPVTTITYALARRAHVRISVFDVTGQLVATLVDTEQDSGDHVARWDGLDASGREAASGVYFCRLSTGERSASIKLVLVR